MQSTVGGRELSRLIGPACETLTAEGCERNTLVWLLMSCDDACVFNGPPISLPARSLDDRISKIRDRRECLREPDMALILLEDPDRFDSYFRTSTSPGLLVYEEQLVGDRPLDRAARSEVAEELTRAQRLMLGLLPPTLPRSPSLKTIDAFHCTMPRLLPIGSNSGGTNRNGSRFSSNVA